MPSENRFPGAASNLKCNYFRCTGAGAFEQTFNSRAYAPKLYRNRVYLPGARAATKCFRPSNPVSVSGSELDRMNAVATDV